MHIKLIYPISVWDQNLLNSSFSQIFFVEVNQVDILQQKKIFKFKIYLDIIGFDLKLSKRMKSI